MDIKLFHFNVRFTIKLNEWGNSKLKYIKKYKKNV